METEFKPRYYEENGQWYKTLLAGDMRTENFEWKAKDKTTWSKSPVNPGSIIPQWYTDIEDYRIPIDEPFSDLDYRKEVEEAYKAGLEIQVKAGSDWVTIYAPSWDSWREGYRIAPSNFTQNTMKKYIAVDTGMNNELSRFIQMEGKKLGIGKQDVFDQDRTYNILFLQDGEFNATDSSWHSFNQLEILSVPDFLARLKDYAVVKVKLNSEYTAEIKGNVVRVGCQTIEFGPILELAEKIKSR